MLRVGVLDHGEELEKEGREWNSGLGLKLRLMMSMDSPGYCSNC